MEFLEYPKALYRGEEFTTVADKAAEDAMRAEGWHDFGHEPVMGSSAEDDLKTQLLEQAKALGISAKGTWGVKKLQDAIAAAQSSSSGAQ